MCYEEDKLSPLAQAIKVHMQIYPAATANRMIEQHTQPARGQRSEVVNLAERLFGTRRKLGINDALSLVQGTDSQLSALRGAIMMVLREQVASQKVPV